MKALITGSLGFVGYYLRKELEQNGYDVVGLDVREGERTVVCDLLDAEQTFQTIQQIQPDIVIIDYSKTTDVSTWQAMSDDLGTVTYEAGTLDGVTGYVSVPLAGCGKVKAYLFPFGRKSIQCRQLTS